MGRSGAKSSKRKSSCSSAIKKKRASRERSKKRSKLGSHKSKKANRRDTSDSFSDDDSSYSSSSSSSFDSSISRSGLDTKRRRSRSLSRKDHKKRSGRRRSLSSDSDESLERVRKRKRSRKSRDSSKKRTKVSKRRTKHSKKKRRREPSVSSSSRSPSRSTSKSSEDGDSEAERNMDRLMVRVVSDPVEFRDQRNSNGVSRSCSPTGFGSKDEEDTQSVETSSRRLRSVIVFTRRSDDEVEEDKFNNDSEQKDEIMYDHDGYPSSKSNDSNDEETRREGFLEANNIVPMRTEFMEALNQKPIPNAHHPSQTGNLPGSQPITNPSTRLQAELDGSLKGSGTEVHVVEAGSNADDLEAILRQRALENLKNFRGVSRASAKRPVLVKGNCDAEVKRVSAKDLDDIGQSKKEVLKVIHDTSSAEKKIHVSPPDVERVDSCLLSEHNANAVKGIDDSIDRSSDKPRQDALSTEKLLLQKERSGLSTSIPAVRKDTSEKLSSVSYDAKVISDSPSEITADASLDTVDPKRPRASMLDKEHLGTDHNSSASDILTSRGSEKNDERSKSQTDPLNRMTGEAEKRKSTTVSTSENHVEGGQSSNQQEQESNDGSQFQQKTMSVMRGGEMVQVSYKVYIPKKAPALARRKLKR